MGIKVRVAKRVRVFCEGSKGSKSESKTEGESKGDSKGKGEGKFSSNNTSQIYCFHNLYTSPWQTILIGGAGEWAQNGSMEFTVRITEMCTVIYC